MVSYNCNISMLIADNPFEQQRNERHLIRVAKGDAEKNSRHFEAVADKCALHKKLDLHEMRTKMETQKIMWNMMCCALCAVCQSTEREMKCINAESSMARKQMAVKRREMKKEKHARRHQRKVSAKTDFSNRPTTKRIRTKCLSRFRILFYFLLFSPFRFMCVGAWCSAT